MESLFVIASGLNPLHCGAVVASSRRDYPDLVRNGVSIPFIAGQWSLQKLAIYALKGMATVSIPFIAGQWSLPSATRLGVE